MHDAFRGQRLHLFAVLSLFASGLAGVACSSDDLVADDETYRSSADDVDTAQAPLGVGGLCKGERCDSVARGSVAFFDRKLHGLGGNGRACADCHMVTDSFQLSPANVEARFQALQNARKHNPNADDPLFRPIDADDFRVNGDNASDYSNLRENGLIRVTIPLPPNVKLIDPATGEVSSETVADLWRSVPSVRNVVMTGPDGKAPVWPHAPNRQGGYQLDARVGTLQDQALGAFLGHAQITGTPSSGMLDDIAAFENALFSSVSAARAAEAFRNGAALPDDIDGPLTPLEQQGKAVFARSCAQCHGGAGLTTPTPAPLPFPPMPRYFDIFSACPRPVDTVVPPRFQFAPCPPRLERNVRIYEVTLSDGTKARIPTSDPGRGLLNGVAEGPPWANEWQTFDAAPLRGISKTAPYFHNNSAATLEAVLDHYEQFFNLVKAFAPPPFVFVPPVLTTDGVHVDRPFTAAERPALLAYLNKL